MTLLSSHDSEPIPGLKRPEIQKDPDRTIPWLHNDYRYWRFGRDKLTTYLKEGLKLSTDSPDKPVNFDGIVEGCEYVTLGEISGHTADNPVLRKPEERARIKAEELGADRESATYYELLLREVLDSSQLELEHVLTGIDHGYSIQYFGIKLDAPA